MLSASFELFWGTVRRGTHFVTICGVSIPFFLPVLAPLFICTFPIKWVILSHNECIYSFRFRRRFLPPFVGWDSEETSTERRKRWERRGKGENVHSTEISLEICFLARYCNISRRRTTINVTRVLHRKWYARQTGTYSSVREIRLNFIRKGQSLGRCKIRYEIPSFRFTFRKHFSTFSFLSLRTRCNNFNLSIFRENAERNNEYIDFAITRATE